MISLIVSEITMYYSKTEMRGLKEEIKEEMRHLVIDVKDEIRAMKNEIKLLRTQSRSYQQR